MPHAVEVAGPRNTEAVGRLAADLVHPILDESIEALAQRVRDDERVRPFADSSLLLR